MIEWTIDAAFRLNEGGRDGTHGHRGYRWEEFFAKTPPPCPSCGSPVRIDPVLAVSSARGDDLYVPGRVSCPNGCRPPR